jgi:plasminogen activator
MGLFNDKMFVEFDHEALGPYFPVSGPNALLKFSPWVEAKDNDEHYMRDLTFREKAGGSNYYSALVDVGYYVTSNAKVFTEFTWSKYSQDKGGTEIIDRVSGESGHLGDDAAGIENKNYSLTAGLQYRF